MFQYTLSDQNMFQYRKIFQYPDIATSLHLFFINDPFLVFAPKIVHAFLKNRSKELFSNCLVDSLLTSIV